MFFATMLKWLLRAGLILASLVSLGALSFSGMLFISPYLSFAIGAFFLATIIEGEVNSQNINQAIAKFFDKRYVEIAIAERELALLIKDEKKLAQSSFLRAYKNQLSKVNQLKQRDQLIDKELEAAENELREMKEFFLQHVFHLHAKPKSTWLEVELAQLVDKAKCQELMSEIARKSLLVKLSWPLSILAGVSTGFVTASALTTCMGQVSGMLSVAFGVTLSSVAITGFIIPIAILAAAAYTYMIYNAVSEMIVNDSLRTWYFKFIERFKRCEIPAEEGKSPTLESTQRWVARIVGNVLLVTILVGLAIFVTVATAGTWWKLVGDGARLIAILTKVTDIICYVTVPAMVFASFIFSIYNSFKTGNLILKIVAKVVHALEEACEEIKEAWQTKSFLEFINPLSYEFFNKLEVVKQITEAWKNENIVQFLNPFRLIIKLISVPFKVAVFIGHIGAIGATTDQLGSIPAAVTATICGVQEAATDLHYIVDDHDHDHQKTCAKPSHEAQGAHHHHTAEPNDDGHHHSDIPGAVLKFALWPLFLLATVWELGFGKLGSAISDKPYTTTFTQIFERYYDFKKPVKVEQQESSADWQKQSALQRIDSRREELEKSKGVMYDPKITEMKCAVYGNLRRTLAKNLDSKAANTDQVVEDFLKAPSPYKTKQRVYNNREVLGMHRNTLFGSSAPGSKCKSDEFLQELRQSYTASAA